jgi:hypothetical protein
VQCENENEVLTTSDFNDRSQPPLQSDESTTSDLISCSMISSEPMKKNRTDAVFNFNDSSTSNLTEPVNQQNIKIMEKSVSSIDTEVHDSSTIHSFSQDPGKWIHVSNALRDYWIERGPDSCQNNDGYFENSARIDGWINGKLPQNIFNKKLHNGENVIRHWLLYSPSKGTLLCFVCTLLSSSDSTWGSVSNGFCDWKHVYERVKIHESSKTHIDAMQSNVVRIYQSDPELWMEGGAPYFIFDSI